MKKLLFSLVLIVACSGGDSTGPAPDDSLPATLKQDEGVIRFTLAANCPSMTVLFGVDQFLFGPESLTPGKSMDYYPISVGVHGTSGKSYPNATTVFAREDITVAAKQRVVRTLSCS